MKRSLYLLTLLMIVPVHPAHAGVMMEQAANLQKRGLGAMPSSLC
jgi:hypothetical protein